MFDGYGDPIVHLKNFCSRLVILENNEALRMRLFIQSLLGITFTWYVKQDFDKWLAWEDMAQNFVEQYKFNIKNDPTMFDLLKVGKLSRESFEEYVIRWRMEASKIRHSPHEEELVQTLIRSLDDIYYKTLFFTGIQSFKIHAIFDSCDMCSKPYNLRVSQLKVRKPRTFIPLMKNLTSIFQRLWANGLLKPREGWIPKHSSSTLDLSTNCVYHLNIQGHDTKECLALRNKIQNMIEKGKIMVQQGPLNNNCDPATENAIIVQGDPTKMYLKPLTRKRKSHRRN
ncbi:hypothetical protein R3W88_011844 [Solanum pinnatisectum]|uniref:Retrotransposon gag domain-containing protein n=1 Tax=Solanum pinnatisectum TaxID=50273 RepID=A0AAV9L7B2_9SOLN|nr:hypothetical protein R3W88_011844 [Solanum pinnatisectum]